MRVPPPIYYLLVFVLSVLLQHWVPLPWITQPLALAVGIPLTVLGLACSATAVPTMLRRHGTLNTAGPSAALVTTGIYRLTRNPMYLALALVYSGMACVFGVVWAFPLLIPLLIYTDIGVIRREERYLARAFGEPYRAYRARVRRWL